MKKRIKRPRFTHNRKKAMAVLSLSAIAFLLAVMLFYSRSVNLKPGPESDFLGQTETDIYKTYMNGEAKLLFLDIAAEHSVDAVRKQDKFMAGDSHNLLEKIPDLQILFKNHKEDFLKAFAVEFAKYLNEFNRNYPGTELKIEDYTFTLDSRGITGVTEKEIKIVTKNHDYMFNPNFRVFIDTGLAEEIAYIPEISGIEAAESEEVSGGSPAEGIPAEEPIALGTD
ncbi:MAG: hypothetical protein V1734_04780 [Nanoarchaeota archaeon]